MSKTKVPDFEKALLLLYVMQVGLPLWADGSPVKVLAKMMGWSELRAQNAFARAVDHGFASQDAGGEK